MTGAIVEVSHLDIVARAAGGAEAPIVSDVSFRIEPGQVLALIGESGSSPIGMIWSGAMMLDFLGNGQGKYKAAHGRILKAIESVLADGPTTPDLGGKGTTAQVGDAIAAAI